MAATIIVLETVQELECGLVTWNGSVHNIVYDLLVTHSLSPGPGLGCTSPANASRTITIQNRAITNMARNSSAATSWWSADGCRAERRLLLVKTIFPRAQDQLSSKQTYTSRGMFDGATKKCTWSWRGKLKILILFRYSPGTCGTSTVYWCSETAVINWLSTIAQNTVE